MIGVSKNHNKKPVLKDWGTIPPAQLEEAVRNENSAGLPEQLQKLLKRP